MSDSVFFETDEEVIGIITLYVGKDYVEETVGYSSAFEAWNKLKEIYEGNSTGELFVNRSCFTKISMKEGQSITSYISKLEKLRVNNNYVIDLKPKLLKRKWS